MLIKKYLSVKDYLALTGRPIIFMTIWATLVVLLYSYFEVQWIDLPSMPLAVIGTAVAFYIGFKNNHAYERVWEARKVWGGIINDSRSLGAAIRAYVGNLDSTESFQKEAVATIHQRILFRHIAWCYTLRSQLLVPTPWEHINQGKMQRKMTIRQMEKIGMKPHFDGLQKAEISDFLNQNELEKLFAYSNKATHLMDVQAQELAALRKANYLDTYYHTKLQDLLDAFFTNQGKCERIKKFPLPRQYGSSSMAFILIFMTLLPFGMIAQFHKLGEYAVWLSVPFSVLVSWVYLMMEKIGDYTENPFEGMANDIPMLSLCRIIEIELKEMLGMENIPSSIEAKEGVLM